MGFNKDPNLLPLLIEGPLCLHPDFLGWLRNFWLFLPTQATAFKVGETIFFKGKLGAMVGERCP